MPVAWAARWRSVLIGQNWSTDREADSKAAADLAARAIELDNQNALALATYGHVRSFLFHDYDVALGYFERALAIDPNLRGVEESIELIRYKMRKEGKDET